MNLVENFMILVFRFHFPETHTGNRAGKIQVLSGFGNNYNPDDHCTDRNEISYKAAEKSSAYNKESTKHPLCNLNSNLFFSLIHGKRSTI